MTHPVTSLVTLISLRSFLVLLLTGLLTAWPLEARAGQDAQAPRPSFRASVDLVTVAAIVRDEHGRLVRNLSKSDFEVIDTGKPQRIVEFRPEEQGPMSLALLFDVSGSMAVMRSSKPRQAAADHVLAWLNPGVDEAALFSFDTQLQELQAFTSDVPMVLHKALDELEPYGATSLFDATAEAAESAARAPPNGGRCWSSPSARHEQPSNAAQVSGSRARSMCRCTSSPWRRARAPRRGHRVRSPKPIRSTKR